MGQMANFAPKTYEHGINQPMCETCGYSCPIYQIAVIWHLIREVSHQATDEISSAVKSFLY